MLKTLALLCCPTLMWAATQGSPEPTFPGLSPHLWVDVGNDNLVPNQPDDRLTASWALGARDGDWLLGAEYGMLTDKAGQSRQDELTIMLGSCLIDESGYRFSISGGVRNYHCINGQDLQNGEHKRVGDPELDLPYDPNLLTAVMCFDFRQTKIYDLDSYRAGYFYVMQDTITSRANEVEVWGGPVLDCTGDDRTLPSFLWVGAGFRSYEGGYYGPTDATVSKAYCGWSFRGGVRLQDLTASLVIGNHASYATIGLCF